ncbi:MAG TPA: protein translocase subunit SecF, partial [Polyangiaceae bacterium]|nr:protein translocase subunit SecF [Polyangiaceae bacterium]
FWIPLSFILVAISVVGVFVWPGPNYGTDFRGGTEVEVAFGTPISAAEVRSAVEAIGFASPGVVQVVDPNKPYHFLVGVQDVSAINDAEKESLRRALCYVEDPVAPLSDPQKCPENARATEVKFSAGGDKVSTRYDVDPDLEKVKEQVTSVPGVSLRASATNPQVLNPRDHRVEIQLLGKGDQLIDRLRQKLGPQTVPPDAALRVEWVGPKAGKQLRDSARNAVGIAIAFIMVYLAFRFDIRFAPGVIVACIHDAMVVIGAFVFFRKEITLSTIAAVLTVIGYSMNDTVVVYDRIRENLGKHRGKSFAQIINLSVSETLSRTILTSGATMLPILAFFFYGTGVIRDFMFALVVGIIAGTYSSIYVAAPLTEWIDNRMSKRSDVKRRLNSPARAT